MIKIRRRELRRLQEERPDYNNPITYMLDDLSDIRVRAHIVRDASFPSILNFTLEEWEYDAFMEMTGIYVGKNDEGVEYRFTFLPSDFMSVISDNYAELNAARMQKRKEISEAYQKALQTEFDEWQTEYDAVKCKPIIYWEKRSK